MITNHSLRFALCGVLLLAPLTGLAAQEMADDVMKDDEGFYVSGAYSAAFPGQRDLIDESTEDKAGVGTGIGFLGGQIGVGYTIAGFRPEISVGYRTAAVDSLTFKEVGGSTAEAALDPLNEPLAEARGGTGITGSITSIDVAASVYYDFDTDTVVTPYVGVGGGLSHVTLNVKQSVTERYAEHEDYLWALAFQAAAGIGYAVTEDLTVTFGYRLIGTLEGNFSTYDTSKRKTGLTLNHNIELGLRYSL